MSPLESLRVALAALMDNKLRSVLTLLGMVIGVGAVISVMSIGRGSSAAITEQIESIGSNLIFVRAAASFQGGVRGAQGSAATLTLDDAQALADSTLTPDVLAVAPEIRTFSQAPAGRRHVTRRLRGAPHRGSRKVFQRFESGASISPLSKLKHHFPIMSSLSELALAEPYVPSAPSLALRGNIMALCFLPRGNFFSLLFATRPFLLYPHPPPRKTLAIIRYTVYDTVY